MGLVYPFLNFIEETMEPPALVGDMPARKSYVLRPYSLASISLAHLLATNSTFGQ